MHSHGVRSKSLLTLLGTVSYQRSRFHCPSCAGVRHPGDEALDILSTSRSPALRRMMARAGSRSTFKEAAEDLRIYAGLRVSAKDVERVAEGIGQQIGCWDRAQRRALLARAEDPPSSSTLPLLYVSYDGTGIPMVRSAVKGRRGRQTDEAKTREVKLGCVFTQSRTDHKGRPVRDPGSTSFVGAIETAEDFGWRIYAEALRRGLRKARRVVVLGDGAHWIRNLTETHFPQATQIIDLYHAREHLSNLCKLLFADHPERQRWFRSRWWRDLDKGQIDRILRQARKYLPLQEDLRQLVETELGYFDTNRCRMQYSCFRRQGLFVGSGVVEAGCKSVIGQRLKRSGMEWSVRGANSIIALRCNIQSGRFEEYWEQRAS